MKETVKFSCGHIGELELPLSATERARKIHWAETSGQCLECFKRSKWKQDGIPDLVRGKSWDGAVYGALHRRYIYVNDERVNVSDEMAATLERYVKNDE